MEENMKAILKDKPEAGFRLVDMPVPEIGKDQVLIKVEAAALCRSDVDVYEWTPLVQKANYDLPFVMGHEFAGTIVKVGESVRGYEEGDRVAGETHIPAVGVRPAGTAISISAATIWGYWEER